jgi:glycerophosphoryl diester phosphodiesterase
LASRSSIDVLRREGFAKQAYILCFDWEILQIAQRLAPEIPVVYLTSGYLQDDTLGIGKAERSKWTGAFNVNDYGGSVPKAITAAGGKFWSPDSRDLDPAQVKEALEAGIGVIVWTVNDQAEMARIIDMGVDGIITDYPDILRQVLVEKGRTVPTPVPAAALCKAAAKFALAVCAR